MTTKDHKTLNETPAPAEQVSTNLDSMFAWKEIFQKLQSPEKLAKAIIQFNPSFVLALENMMETHVLTLDQKTQENIKYTALIRDGFDLQRASIPQEHLTINVPSTPNDMFAYAKHLYFQEDFYASSRWYLKAAEQGHLFAQHKLVWLCYSGTCGIQQDQKEAYKWLYKVVIQMRANHAKNTTDKRLSWASLDILGQCIQSLEHPSDSANAKVWFMSLLFAHEKVDETWFRNKISKNKKNGVSCGTELFMLMQIIDDNANTIAEKKQLLVEAVQQEFGPALHEIAQCYRFGTRGFPLDKLVSIQYMKRAAEKGNNYSQNSYGYYLDTGIGTQTNYKEAFEWYLKAANNWCPIGQYNLGLCYLGNNYVQRDIKEGIRWLKLASNYHSPAMTELVKLQKTHPDFF